MRRFLLASAACAALLCVAAPARAQVATIDVAAIAQLANQLNNMRSQLTTQVGIFGSLMRQFDPNSIARGLPSNGLPGAEAIGQMITGEGEGGRFGGLSTLADRFLGRNTAYRPESTGEYDYNAGYMDRRGNTYASLQAAAQQSMHSIEQRLTNLDEIEQQLSVVQSSADIEAVQARLQAEQAIMAGQGVQATQLQNLLAAQNAHYDLQQSQMARRSADALLQRVSGGGLGNGLGNVTSLISSLNVPTYVGR